MGKDDAGGGSACGTWEDAWFIPPARALVLKGSADIVT